ncbi:down syndrome cell adhesion molecule-like protein Dscam2 [Nephila pilipes]|uniref:Down syndrome cell adhesion molecule-like protein Dscam2 n=1 Tax=Nephila pilipes TaxID=299642 RepID=A0A8X6MZK2_NEPPI|nr:down syndrome cell adhesion molecule-like protein Dscam2 [Nephila pilipes]
MNHLAGGSKLPYGDRQSIDQRGIVRIHSVRKEDEGIYRCVATNGRGEKAERPLVLKVVIILCNILDMCDVSSKHANSFSPKTGRAF